MGEQKTTASSVNRAKTYQLVLFPLNNGATNVYYVPLQYFQLSSPAFYFPVHFYKNIQT